jgi:hypothetical protein
MLSIATKHPSLKNKIALHQEDYYLKGLSPGIRIQAQLRLAKLI